MTSPARCPSCKGPVAADARVRPFCSERCRTIDLGNWLDGRYRVAGEQHLDERSEAGTPERDDD